MCLNNELDNEHDALKQEQPIIQEAPPLRRSTRKTSQVSSSSQPSTPAPAIMSEPRRNPKRKANEAASDAVQINGRELLEEALQPLSLKDIEEWEGWIELESEPAFFNTILRDLGVQNVKAQEIFTIDQESLAILPKPVYGLIFLFQYLPGFDEITEEVDTADVWFANQTIDNACATVALLNIIMNAEGVEIGTELQEFKASTKDLNTALRGHQLSKNNFIRSIHNSFTRRMDHLNADLCLDNEMSDAASKKTKKRVIQRKGKKTARRKVKSDYGYHFIAYVPAGGYVWELDGLRSRPQRLDAVPDDGDWTSVARPQIEGRMLQYEENQLSFNLLGLCQNPLASHSQAIAHAAVSLQHLQAKMQSCNTFTDHVLAETKPLDIHNETQLSEFGLKPHSITDMEALSTLEDKILQPGFDAAAAYQLHHELAIELKAAMGEYRAELISIADDEQRVKGRKKDYGPALHKWVKKLAEKGALEDVIKTSQ